MEKGWDILFHHWKREGTLSYVIMFFFVDYKDINMGRVILPCLDILEQQSIHFEMFL